MRLRVVLTSTVTMTLALCGAASAAVTASEDATTITVTGTAANDVTVLSDEGTDVRITDAVAGANCVKSGSDVLCPRGSRTITASLQAGDDDITKLAGGHGVLDGGTGIDTVSYTGRTSGMTIDLAAGTAESTGVLEHRLASFERANGSDGNDVITGTSGPNTLQGGAGDDRLVPGPGSDSVRGGTGTDTLDYSASPVGIHANLEPVGGLRVHEFAATPTDDVLADTFEVLTGSPFADVLRGGNQAANSIRGGSGNDVLDGLGGDDTLSC
jgi:Ca2+-binding RTX toxin-like protein